MTSACVIFKFNGHPVMRLLSTCDGYPEGRHGMDTKLCKFFSNIKIINGIAADVNTNDISGRIANGWDDAILQFIVANKTSVGTLYCVAIDAKLITENFEYILDFDVMKNTLRTIQVKAYADTYNFTTFDEFKKFCETYQH